MNQRPAIPAVLSQIDQDQLREVAQRYGLDLILLFGSHARGRQRPESDVDLAVHTTRRGFGRLEPGEEVTWELKLFDDLSAAVPAPEGIDLVVLNRADSTLQFESAREGIPAFQADPDRFHEFRSLTSRRFYDDAKYRRWGREYVRRRARHGD